MILRAKLKLSKQTSIMAVQRLNLHTTSRLGKSDWETLPRTTRKVFLPNYAKKRVEIIKPIRTEVSEVKIGPRVNKMNIQMLSKSVYSHLFKGYQDTFQDSYLIDQCKKSLEKHDMLSKEIQFIEDVNLNLPELEGANLEEHFFNIAENQSKPYRDLVLDLLRNIPEKPKSWIMQEGWTKYQPFHKPVKVDFPEENALIFDVEVCVLAGKGPTLATAVGRNAWYGWVSQALVDGTHKPVTSHQYSQDVLIPLESNTKASGINFDPDLLKPKVVIGHNVSYDRARVKEQYWLDRTGLRFVDTMSMHICVSGLTSYQRAVLKSGKENEEDDSWKNYSSLNNLSEVHKLYCGKTIEKEQRNLFVEGTMQEIKESFQNVMNYCSGDVIATHNVMKKLFPLFLDRFPHPATFAGMLELGTAYLPVNSNWERYISDSTQTYEDLDIESRLLLARRADQACQLLHDEKYKEDIWMWDQDWEVKEIRMKKTITKRKVTKAEDSTKAEDFNKTEDFNKAEQSEYSSLTPKKSEDEEEPDLLKSKFEYLFETRSSLPAIKTLLPGYPNWYRKLCSKPDSPDWVPGPHLISTSMQVTPKLLSLTWEGYPLHFIRGLGWGLLVPFSTDTTMQRKLPLNTLLEMCPVSSNKSKAGSGSEALKNIASTVQDNLARKEYYSRLKQDHTDGQYVGSGIWSNTILEDCCWFFKLPHKDGASYRVGNPLAKDFLNKFSENVLAGETESAEQVLSIARQLSYWRNNRDRISEQMVVWLDKNSLPFELSKDGNHFGAIVPQVVVCGTLTRRAMEPTWMTASNAHPERIGSELRAMVQAPPGYNFVGADVDSQELWIASLLGDADYAKMHGATPFGWMTLSGAKAEGTDMHSVTAKAVGISRDHAKVINYARIYGAGQNFAERLLKQFNPTISESEARNKSIKMFNLTKGKRIFHLRKEFILDLPDQPYSKWQAFEIAKTHGKTVREMFHMPKWVGGTESAMFNRLEEIANHPMPKTPFLNSRLSRALEPKTMSDERFLPTRVNWVVQSGAVDFLHLMLVCMKWLLGDKARFCLSFHDEIRYLVPEHYKYQAALAMHVTNLFTRAYCSVRVGLYDLPQSVAFFSSVEVDTVLRKESKHDCRTPSNPHGLGKGYGIENGESLNIYEAVQKGGGHFKWYSVERQNVQSDEKEARATGSV